MQDTIKLSDKPERALQQLHDWMLEILEEMKKENPSLFEKARSAAK